MPLGDGRSRSAIPGWATTTERRSPPRVAQLGRWVGDGQRHGHTAGPPDAPLDRHVGEAGGSQEGDPGLAQVLLSARSRSRGGPEALAPIPLRATPRTLARPAPIDP